MDAVICTLIGLIALYIGFLIGKSKSNCEINPRDLAEKINFSVGAENETLKGENEELKVKLLLYNDWFIRSYVEQYYRRNLEMKDGRIYTSDALEDLRQYSQKALDNFQKTWNAKCCNEQCMWVKEYLEELISHIDHLLSDTFDNDVIDLENEQALRRFFVDVEMSMMCDRSHKKAGREIVQLGYWHPQC